MKAISIRPGIADSMALMDVPEPPMGRQDVRVKVMRVGVCGTDLELKQGLYGQAPPGSDHLVMPTRPAISRSEVASKPFSAKTCSAASRMRWAVNSPLLGFGGFLELGDLPDFVVASADFAIFINTL